MRVVTRASIESEQVAVDQPRPLMDQRSRAHQLGHGRWLSRAPVLGKASPVAQEDSRLRYEDSRCGRATNELREGLTMAAEQSRKRQIAEQSRERQIAEDNPREIRKVIAQIEESLRVLSGIAQRTRAKRLLVSGAAVTGAALVAKRLASRPSGLDFGRLFERMPENAPPKLMFRNISAIRDNTERILRLLESERTTAGPELRRDPAL
jgi:hypothetical protein